MAEHAVPVGDEASAQSSDGVQAIDVGQITVVDRQVDVKERIGGGGNAMIDVAVEIDDDGNAAVVHRLPVLDRAGKEQPASVIELHDLVEHEAVMIAMAAAQRQGRRESVQ
jgi:hypothetical protein